MKLPVPMTVVQIAGFIGGTVHGPEDVTVSGIAVDPRLATEDDIALVTDRKLLKNLDAIKAKIVIAPVGTEERYPERCLILVKRPKMAIAKITSVMKPRRFFPAAGVHPTAIIDESAEIGEGVAIGPHVCIGPHVKIGAGTVISAGCTIGGKVTIGEKCLFYPGCNVADYAFIGSRVVLHMGVAIGSDGFGYTTERPANAELIYEGAPEDQLSDDRNPLVKIEQIGNVVIGDDVEIGANSTIDRGTIGSTVIGDGTKIDNLVLVAHNCEIGSDCIIVANTSIGGSTKIGNRVIIAATVSIKDHTKIGDDAIVEATSGVMKDIPSRAVQVGTPACDARQYMTQLALIRRLPKMNDEVRSLKKRITQLEQLLLEKQLTK